MSDLKSPDDNGWHIILWRADSDEELQRHTPPVAQTVLLWNRRPNGKHAGNSHRIGAYAMENTCDCSHWMPYTEGMEMPPPPTDFSHFD